MSQISEFRTQHFRLAPVGPDMISDNWIRWSRDQVLMAQLNVRPMQRADIQRYVAAAWKRKQMIIGIYELANGEHIGNYEAAIDPHQGNVRLEMLVDPQSSVLSRVLTETDPIILQYFAHEHRVEKAVAEVVETHTALISHLETTGWQKEGVLRKELAAAFGNHRLDAVQFGRLLVAEQ